MHLPITIALLVIAGLLLLVGARLWRGRWFAKLLAMPLLLAGVTCFAAGAYHGWLTHRPQPESIDSRELFHGITYTRDVRRHPRPMVIHLVRIDLRAEGVSFRVTPGKAGTQQQMPARTTGQFAREFGVQVAINGAFFTTFDQGPVEPGMPVFALGLNASDGVVYSPGREPYTSLNITADNRAMISTTPGDVHNAVAGWGVLLRDGIVPDDLPETNNWDVPNPRTAVAIADDGATLLLVVVDGRQPNYSEGVRLDELGTILASYGGHDALNLDGGGSSTLVITDAYGLPYLLNSPIHDRLLPGTQRPVANHLGVFAKPTAR